MGIGLIVGRPSKPSIVLLDVGFQEVIPGFNI